MNAARGHTPGTAEGHALFLNPSERETGESTSRPTKMKVTEKVGALLRSVKPAVRRYATARGSRDFDPRGLLCTTNLECRVDGYSIDSRLRFLSFEDSRGEKVMHGDPFNWESSAPFTSIFKSRTHRAIFAA